MSAGLLPNPSVRQILWSDYPAFIATAVPVTAWIVDIIWVPNWGGNGAVLMEEWRPVYLWAAAIFTIFGLAVVLWRVQLFRRLFRTGVQVRGNIMEFRMRNDRGQVKYTFIYDHKEYFSGAHLHRNRLTKALKEGDAVILIVDRNNPERAYIRDLYI